MAATTKPQLTPLAVHAPSPPASPPRDAPAPQPLKQARRLRLPARGWGAAKASAAVLAGAVALWLLTGVGFVNYDTLYGLVWGQQLAHGEVPRYGIQMAPTPHPLIELLGACLAPLGARATATIMVALAFIALSACGWALYRLGRAWFGATAGALAAAVALTRVPILSYGVRAYVDVPYMLFVLLALLVETRRRRAGAPVLALLALAGLLRPEAWAFSAAYWLYLVLDRSPRTAGGASWRAPHVPQAAGGADERAVCPPQTAGGTSWRAAHTPRELAALALLALAAPTVWLLGDLLATGDPLWSLANTKHMAHQLGRITGVSNVPEYVPRRIGEIMRPAGLASAAIGGVLSLLWLGPRARLGACAGLLAVGAFALTAAFGLPIDTRYAFLAAGILSVFCGAGAFGWLMLPRGDVRRRIWMALGAVLTLALLASLPTQLRSSARELAKLSRQQQIQDDLLAFTRDGALSPRCGPVGVPNHAPIPLLALYLGVSPTGVVDSSLHQIERGAYVDPASMDVEREYALNADARDRSASIPPGFVEAAADRSWLLFARCA